MANNTFEFVGKLSIGKESEKFKPYTTESYPSGWTNNKLLFNVVAGDNRHMLESKGGYFANGEGKIYTFSKGGKDAEGNQIKGEKLEILWKNRFNPKEVEKVAEFKKFVIDLEEYGRRYKLERILDGTASEKDVEELNVEDINTEIENSRKKRKEFIAESDYTEYLYKVISSGKVDNRLFKVLGNIVYQYSDKTGKYYRKYVPSRIYLVEKDAIPTSTGQLTVFFNKDSVDKSLLSKTNKININTYIREYDNTRKETIGCPVTLVLDTSKDETNEANKKLNNLFEKQFTVKDKTWKEIGVKIKILDGSQKVEITPDMLDETQQELLELGAITLDDIRKEMGDTPLYGDRISEMVIVNVAKGYTKGRKDTLYNADDFIVKPLEIKKDNKSNDNNDEDIFADMDLDLE